MMWHGELTHREMKSDLPISVHLGAQALDDMLAAGRDAVTQGWHFTVSLLPSGGLGGAWTDTAEWRLGPPPRPGSKWLALDWTFSAAHGSARMLPCLLRVTQLAPVMSQNGGGGDSDEGTEEMGFIIEICLPEGAPPQCPRPEGPRSARDLAGLRRRGLVLSLERGAAPEPRASTARLGTSIQRAVMGLFRALARLIGDAVPAPASAWTEGRGIGGGSGDDGGGGGYVGDAAAGWIAQEAAQREAQKASAARAGGFSGGGSGGSASGSPPDVVVLRLWHVRLERPLPSAALWTVLQLRARLQRLAAEWPLLAPGHPATDMGWLRDLIEVRAINQAQSISI